MPLQTINGDWGQDQRRFFVFPEDNKQDPWRFVRARGFHFRLEDIARSVECAVYADRLTGAAKARRSRRIGLPDSDASRDKETAP